jgi:hypothetical protein
LIERFDGAVQQRGVPEGQSSIDGFGREVASGRVEAEQIELPYETSDPAPHLMDAQ